MDVEITSNMSVTTPAQAYAYQLSVVNPGINSPFSTMYWAGSAVGEITGIFGDTITSPAVVTFTSAGIQVCDARGGGIHVS